MGLLSKIFKIYTQKYNLDCNEALVIKFLFFKIKFKKTPSETNQVYIDGKKQSLKNLKAKSLRFVSAAQITLLNFLLQNILIILNSI